MPDVDSSAVSGVEVRGFRRGALSTDSWDQYVIPVRDRMTSFQGRGNSFVTPGRAAASQKVLALHNATSSPVFVQVNRITVDVSSTVIKAVTVVPPLIRVHRFTAIPTNGTLLAKVPRDTALSSSSSVTLWGDASADGTGSGTTLTITIPASNIIAQHRAPRLLTGATLDPADPIRFFDSEPDITLRALEGVCVFLDQATATTGNPSTDAWVITIDWEEFTRP